MAVLSDQGARCAVLECSRVDFLPFTCDRCNKVHCLDHFRYADHACPHAAGLDNRVLVCPLCAKGVRLVAEEDPNLTWETHMLTDCAGGGAGPSGAPKKERCPVPGCKEALTQSNCVTCPKCKKRVCLKHRYEESHECLQAKQLAPTVVPAARRPPQAAAPAAKRASAGRSGGGTASAGTPAGTFDAHGGWSCGQCTLQNSAGAIACAACGGPPPRRPPWKCARCTLENDGTSPTCAACDSPAPAVRGSGGGGGRGGGTSTCTLC
eukprot:TRINITY_DN19203_c0_g1_i1.p1 TRINITY_DN19203_c0_g1~~TRINITY_DN19203_c0_g1_i1.p1  ORF type:complete len:265 (-),score=49.37 TRINITY_DN19203_c0_g1_i1:111-905(-)